MDKKTENKIKALVKELVEASRREAGIVDEAMAEGRDESAAIAYGSSDTYYRVARYVERTLLGGVTE